MITAHEALALPGAQLTADQRQTRDNILDAMDKTIRSDMTFHGGVHYRTSCTDPDVIQAVVNEARLAGWRIILRATGEPGLTGQPRLSGFDFEFHPLDAVYDETARATRS